MTTCELCAKEFENDHVSICWQCHVAQLELRNSPELTIITPNNLPIRVIRGNTLLEHEHADHPNYMFPVSLEYIGDEKGFVYIEEDGSESPMEEDYKESLKHEDHALIYTDGTVAVTMYEYCFAMWYVRTGEYGGGSLWDKKTWKLSKESCEKIKALGLKNREHRSRMA